MNIHSPDLGSGNNDLFKSQTTYTLSEKGDNTQGNNIQGKTSKTNQEEHVRINYLGQELLKIAQQKGVSQEEKAVLIKEILSERAKEQARINKIIGEREAKKSAEQLAGEILTDKNVSEKILEVLGTTKKDLVAILTALTIAGNPIIADPSSREAIPGVIEEAQGLANKVGNFIVGSANAGEININKLEIEENKRFSDVFKGLEIGKRTKEEMINQIRKTVGKDGNSMTSFYDEKSKKEYVVSVFGDMVGIHESPIEETRSIKNKGEKIIQEKKNKQEEREIYENGGRGVEIVKEGNDAILTFFGFSGGREERDGQRRTKDKISMDVGISGEMTEYVVLGGGVKIGPEQLAFLAHLGIDFGKYGNVVILGETYKEKIPFTTTKGEIEKSAKQNQIAAAYNKELNKGPLHALRGEVSYKKGKDIKGIDKDTDTQLTTEVIDTPDSTITRETRTTTTRTLNNIGGKEVQGAIDTIWKLSDSQKLTAGVQITDRRYNDGERLGTDVGGRLFYEQVMNEIYKLRLGVTADEHQQTFTGGVYRKLGPGEVGLNTYYTNRDGSLGRDDSGIMATYSQSFGGGKKGEEKGNKYELFPNNEEGSDLKESARDFQQRQSSNSLGIRRTEEETKVTTEVKEVVRPKKKPSSNKKPKKPGQEEVKPPVSEKPETPEIPNTPETPGVLEITKIPNQTGKIGDSVNLEVKASDGATVQVTGLPDGLSYSGGRITGTLTRVGTYTVNIEAKKGGLTTTKSFNFEVTDVSTPINTPSEAPVIDEIPNQSLTVGSSVSILVKVSEGASVNVSGLPKGLSYSGGRITGTLTRVGNYTVNIEAKKGGLTTTKSFNFEVTDVSTPINTPPTAPSLPDVTVGDGGGFDPISISLPSPNDPDGDTVTCSASGLPSGLSLNGCTNISGNHDSYGDENYNVTIYYSDGKWGTSSSSFNLRIEDNG